MELSTGEDHQELGGRKKRSLTLAGRLTLINLVLRAIPIYWMVVFQFSMALIQKINKICKDFLWCDQENVAKSNTWLAGAIFIALKDWEG